jgi:hypothetical protein
VTGPTVDVDRSRWLTVLAELSRRAPPRQHGYYLRLRNLRPAMADDGWLSQPADRLRRLMGAEVSLRTSVETLTYGVEHGLLRRKTFGGRRHQAEYKACLPVELAEPRTLPVMRLDARTGERLPNGRVRRPSVHTGRSPLRAPNGENPQDTGPSG